MTSAPSDPAPWTPSESEPREASSPSVETPLESPIFTGTFDGSYVTEEAYGARFSLRIRRLLHEERSSFQKIAVYESEEFGNVLTLDDLVMLTERDEFVYHEMLTHVPLLSLSDPKSVLIIGGGDCGCIREVLRHPVERIVQCEIDERVTRVCEEHFPWVREVVADSRVELVFDDGAEFLRRHRGEFDLVIIDSTDPTGPALGLFTPEFYRSAAASLRPGGALVAQTESPHYAPELVGRIYERIGTAFAHTHLYVGSIPTYPSGYWTWAYASNDRQPHDDFDEERAVQIGDECLYYQPELQRGAFALPAFVKRALAGDDPFARFRPEASDA
ncbi:MAG: polyamine aminopropyltransferase [Planctomycetota bacterium]